MRSLYLWWCFPLVVGLVSWSSSPVVFVLSCDAVDRDSLLSFHRQVVSSPPLDWPSAGDCCQWEGVFCDGGRVTGLSLPARGLFGRLHDNSSFLASLSYLSHLNLSNNRLWGPLPPALPPSIRTLDLSSNRLNGSLDPSLFRVPKSIFNVSNNTLTGPLPSPSTICSPLATVLDFSSNQFTGPVLSGFGDCSNLRIFRAGFNFLSGWLPDDLHRAESLAELSLPNNRLSGPITGSILRLPKLKILELHVNQLSGNIPRDIDLLSGLEQLQLHTNNLSGTLPPSLTGCTNLTTLLLRNNRLTGQITALDFSKLQRLQAIDLGNNSFTGNIPASLCMCRSLTAVRLAYNQLTGELPSCVASLKNLAHLSLSNNYLSNVIGALRILRHCDNLAVLFLSRCFQDEMMPEDGDLLHLNGFQNLQIFTLGGCGLKGRIPSWIAKLRRLKVLNLSYNRITGPIPTWLGDMPSLFVLNLTQNSLTGGLPRELTRMPALISDNTSSDLSYLALPFLFDSLQYNRLFNLPRGLKVGNNSLSGNIPPEIGRLVLLHVLDLSNNEFNGSIPDQLSGLINLERLDLSANHLTGQIPRSLTGLHFLSAFSVANNELQGEIPKGGQFDTFPEASFAGNPKLCGNVLRRSCQVVAGNEVGPRKDDDEDDDDDDGWQPKIPFGTGYFVGFFAVSITLVFYSHRRRASGDVNDNEESRSFQ